MDPTTVLTTTETACQVGEDICTIGSELVASIRAAPVIDNALEQLKSEVQSYPESCGTLWLLLKQVSTLDKEWFDAQDATFRNKLKLAIEMYEQIVERFRDSVKTLQTPRAKLWKQVFKQRKINTHEGHLETLRLGLGQRMAIIHFMIRTLTVCEQLHSPTATQPQSLPRMIDQLEEAKFAFQDRIGGIGDGEVGKSTLKENAYAIVGVAEQVLEKASTVYGDTITARSDAGDLFNIRHSTFSHHDLSLIDASDPVLNLEPSDNGHQNNIIFAQNVICSADEAFSNANTQSDYEKARKKLQECAELARKLIRKMPPERLRSLYDAWKKHYQLAVCSFYLDETPESQKIIEMACAKVPSTDDQRQNLFHLSRLLAQIHVRNGRLEDAQELCWNVYDSQCRLFRTREHDECYESVALMKRIYDLQGCPSLAQARLDMIPDDKREHYASKFEALEPGPEPASSEITNTSTAAIATWQASNTNSATVSLHRPSASLSTLELTRSTSIQPATPASLSSMTKASEPVDSLLSVDRSTLSESLNLPTGHDMKWICLDGRDEERPVFIDYNIKTVFCNFPGLILPPGWFMSWEASDEQRCTWSPKLVYSGRGSAKDRFHRDISTQVLAFDVADGSEMTFRNKAAVYGEATALSSHEKRSKKELSFKTGDVIEVLKRKEGDARWWTGKLNNREGLIPREKVEVRRMCYSKEGDGSVMSGLRAGRLGIGMQ